MAPALYTALSLGRGADIQQLTGGGSTTEPATTLDATGLLCPLPVLKARRALNEARTVAAEHAPDALPLIQEMQELLEQAAGEG